MIKHIAQAAIVGLFVVLGLGSGMLYRHVAGDPPVETRPLDLKPFGIADGAAPVMLTLSTCPVCKQARAWLEQNGIEYTEMVIDQSDEASTLASSLGVQAVPVFLYSGKQQTGFDPDSLRELLEPEA